MKNHSLLKITLFTCTLGLAIMPGAKAQDADTNADASPSSGGHHHHRDSVLTPAERAELKNDREQALAANPDLKTEETDLKSDRSSAKGAAPGDKKADHEKWHAFMDKLDAAEEKIDPNAAALIAKLKAAHHHHHDKSGTGTDAAAGTDSGSTSGE